MVRDSRIKTLNLADNGDWSGTNIFSAATVTEVHSKTINGEILAIEWKYNRTGSLALSISGTAEEFFRRNLPSGTGWQTTQPRVFGDSTTGSIAGADQFPFYVNSPIVLNAGSLASGTQPLDITVKYR